MCQLSTISRPTAQNISSAIRCDESICIEPETGRWCRSCWKEHETFNAASRARFEAENEALRVQLEAQLGKDDEAQ